MPRSTPRPPLIGLNSRTFEKFLSLGAKESCSHLCAPSHAVLPPILPPILQHTHFSTNQIAIMPALLINWNTLQALPKSTTPIIERGWITLSLLEPIEGQERRIQPRCTLCNQSFGAVPARTYARTSNWLNHIRSRHPEQAAELDPIQASSSIGSSSAQPIVQPQITPFTLNQRVLTNQELRDLVRDVVVTCTLPLRVDDSAVFQKLIKATRALGAVNRAIISQEITAAF